MTHYYLGYISLALYTASFLCYARLLYVPDLWLGRHLAVSDRRR